MVLRDSKLLLFDLDGTLLRSDKTISRKTLKAIRDCRKKGILIGMLELCGKGIAMGNAVEEVKEKADLVIGSNDEDGVAEYLELTNVIPQILS